MTSKEIKKVVEKAYLKKKGNKIHPFIYLSLRVPPENIDVNVHPSKEEVYILHETLICETLEKDILQVLENGPSSDSKNPPAKKNNVLPQPNVAFSKPAAGKSDEIEVPSPEKQDAGDNNITNSETPISPSLSTSKSLGVTVSTVTRKANDNASPSSSDFMEESREQSENAAKKKMKQTTLDGGTVTNSPTPSKPSKRKQEEIAEDDLEEPPAEPKTKRPKKRKDEEELLSILELRAELEANSDKTLTTAMRKNKFIGVVDPFYSMIQFKDTLYLLNTEKITEELFYQLILKKFSKFSPIYLEPAPALFDLLLISLDHPSSSYEESLGPKNSMAQVKII